MTEQRAKTAADKAISRINLRRESAMGTIGVRDEVAEIIEQEMDSAIFRTIVQVVIIELAKISDKTIDGDPGLAIELFDGVLISALSVVCSVDEAAVREGMAMYYGEHG